MEQLNFEDRRVRGVQTISGLMNVLLSRCDWRHGSLAAVANWVSGEQSPLHTTQISRMRNGMTAKPPTLAQLDALAEVNAAIWLWRTEGAEAAIERYGPPSSWGVETEWLDRAEFLPSAADPSQPLNLGEMVMVLAGRLTLPYLTPWDVGRGDGGRICAGISALLEQIAQDQGWGPGKAAREFGAAYPSTDRNRQKRLIELINGRQLRTDELPTELPALAEMIRRVWNLESYGPVDLLNEAGAGTTAGQSHP